MRIFYVAPLLIAFGCAHEKGSNEGMASASTPAATASPMPAETPPAVATVETPAAPSESAPIAAKESDKTKVCPAVRVHFVTDSAMIDDSEKPALDLAAACLSSNDRLRVVVEGNADERGTDEYNLDLGRRRAHAVRDYLEDKGVGDDQIQALISFGEDNPLCDESDADCWAKNRRTAVRATCHL